MAKDLKRTLSNALNGDRGHYRISFVNVAIRANVIRAGYRAIDIYQVQFQSGNCIKEKSTLGPALTGYKAVAKPSCNYLTIWSLIFFLQTAFFIIVFRGGCFTNIEGTYAKTPRRGIKVSWSQKCLSYVGIDP